MVRWAFTTVTDHISESSPCKTATKTTTNMQPELTACDVCLQANLFTLNCSAHMLALLQDVMEAPGGSATGLLPSTNSPQDEAQVLHEQPSEDAPVLQVDILLKAQVCNGPV